MTVNDVLVGIRELLSDERRWTQNTSARAASGKEVLPISPDAVCWCITGAAEKLCGSYPLRGRVYKCLEQFSDGQFIDAFNDTHTHEEVLSALDRAIAATSAEGRQDQ